MIFKAYLLIKGLIMEKGQKSNCRSQIQQHWDGRSVCQLMCFHVSVRVWSLDKIMPAAPASLF